MAEKDKGGYTARAGGEFASLTETDAQVRELLGYFQQVMQNVDVEALTRRGADRGGEAGASINSAGTAGTYGTLTGCLGTFGSFGSYGGIVAEE